MKFFHFACWFYIHSLYKYPTTFFCLTVLTIGWERNLTTVTETQGSVQICLRILDVDEPDVLTGFSVMLFIGTVRGTAAGKLL